MTKRRCAVTRGSRPHGRDAGPASGAAQRPAPRLFRLTASRRVRAGLPEGKTLEDLLDSIRAKVYALYPQSVPAWVEATKEGTVVVCVADEHFEHTWGTDESGEVVVSAAGRKVERRVDYVPAGDAAPAMASHTPGVAHRTRIAGAVVARTATEPGQPRVVDIVIIRAGVNACDTGIPGVPGFVDDTDEGLGSILAAFGGAAVHWYPPQDGVFGHPSLSPGEAKWMHSAQRVGYATHLRREAGAIHAKLLVDAEVPDSVLDLIIASADPGKPAAAKPVGLSIDAYALHREKIVGGRRVIESYDFQGGPNGPPTIDIVSFPAAGGEFLRVAAARREERPMNFEQALVVLRDRNAPAAQRQQAARIVANAAQAQAADVTLAGRVLAGIPDDPAPGTPPAAPAAPATAPQAASNTPAGTPPTPAPAPAPVAAAAPTPPAPVAPAPTPVQGATLSLTQADIERLRRLELSEARGHMTAALVEAGLAERYRPRVERVVAARIESDPAFRIDAAAIRRVTLEEVDDVRALLAGDSVVRGAGRTTANADGSRVEVGAGFEDRSTFMFERMLLQGAPRDVQDEYARRHYGGAGLDVRAIRLGLSGQRPIWSLREHFRVATGHDYLDLCAEGTRERVRASISSTTYPAMWANTLGRVARAYFSANEYNWRELVRITPLPNFKSRTMIHTGGYGDLPIVAEREPYPKATTPTERSESYTPATRGVTEDWSRRAMIDDDLRLLQSIPRKLGLAAARTLYKFITDKLFTIAGQPTMSYDSVTLYHAATHGNLRTAAGDALGADSIAAQYIAMLGQADFVTGEPLGIRGTIIVYPTALMKAVHDALKALERDPGGSTLDRSFVNEIPWRPHRNPLATNAKDWFMAVTPDSELCAEVGFVNGQEEPELFVNDNESLGTMFDRDVAVVKIRHEYGFGLPSHQGYAANDIA